MTHQVFICYSTQDKAVAEEVCATLEKRHIECWIAPRDVLPGMEWAESIVDALDGCSVLVLVLSSSSNTSPQVIREVGRAASNGTPIIPLRIDDVSLSKSMDYFISRHQWLDALTPPLKKHLQKLANTVQQILDQKKITHPAIEITKSEEKVRKETEEAIKAKKAEEIRKNKEAEKEDKIIAREAKEKAKRAAEEARKAREDKNRIPFSVEKHARAIKTGKPLIKQWWLWSGVAAVFVVLILVFVFIFILPRTEEQPKTAEEHYNTEVSSELKTIVPGFLTVGSDCTHPPMEFIVENNNIAGFDLDLAVLISKKLGLGIDYQNAAWDGLFPALIAHKYDMVISSITISDDRKKEVDFSDPYYKTDQAAIVKEDSGIDSPDKLNGKKAGAAIGSTGELAAREIEGLTVQTYDNILLAFDDLNAGRIDAVIADSYVGYTYAKNNKALTVGFSIVTGEQLGIAFAKDTPELLKAVNEALKSIKEEGTYDIIYDKYFGQD